jgi:hypothetical protein
MRERPERLDVIAAVTSSILTERARPPRSTSVITFISSFWRVVTQPTPLTKTHPGSPVWPMKVRQDAFL